MQHYKITVGIISYNAESYIKLCLDSIYSQTIKDNIKVVLLNDCSTDNAQYVIDNWVSEHLDFNILIAHNDAGILLLLLQLLIHSTQYVLLIDGNNFLIKNDCLEYMYNFIEKHGCDFVNFSSECLMKFELYLLIKFSPFRYNDDMYKIWLTKVTDNYILHDYEFLYYRNINKPVVEETLLQRVFNDVYYRGITESVEQLQFITPELKYEEIYNEMLLIRYEIHPAVLVLSKTIDLTDWVSHYKSLGFEHIFVVGNDQLSDYVTNIPYDYTKFNNYSEYRSSAYDYALRIIRNTNTNYLLVVDDDEYLELKDTDNITTFIIEELAALGKYNCDFVLEAYGDNDRIYESEKRTFNKKVNKLSCINLTKSLVRLTLDICYNKSDNPAYYPNNYSINKVNVNKAVIKHYITPCLETFLKTKVANNNFDQNEFGERDHLSAYFKVNKCSEKKLLAYKQLCSKYNIPINELLYQDLLDVIKDDKIALIVPVDAKCDLSKIKKSDQYDIILAATIDVDYSDDYKIIRGYSSIYDCLNYAIKQIKHNYTAIVFPTSKLHADKFSKQMAYLTANPEVDIVTCDCTSNGVKNTKPIISTVVFRTESVKDLPFIFEHYYNTYDKFFVNCKHLNIVNIDEVLQEEQSFPSESIYNIYDLESSQNLCKPLTAVINFRNEGYEVEKTVQSIRATTKGVPILLIDDCSNDEYDYEGIAGKYHCLYIKNLTQLGATRSRDMGARMCYTPYFILLDGHMRFYNLNWDELFIKLLDENPKRLVCGNSTTITKSDNTYYGELNMCSATFGAFVDFHLACLFNTCWAFSPMDEGDVTRISCVLGACYASSKEHWEHINGLAGLTKYGYEEPLMSIKTWMCGGECLLLKKVYIGHLYRNKFPFTVTGLEMIVNLLFLTILFDVDNADIYESLDSATRTKVLNLLDVNKAQQLKSELDSIKKHPFEYFLSINNKALQCNENN